MSLQAEGLHRAAQRAHDEEGDIGDVLQEDPGPESQGGCALLPAQAAGRDPWHKREDKPPGMESAQASSSHGWGV